ncbi:hypothetical protein H0P51_08115 [Mycobacterium vicinigordonae]|uniref:Uncharacterized protein n=1 Tax=Mycobacterium vicinigordonae TaxID=1719132 RepID=A0A7D6I4X8_9MYCO|nr:hypothetical protein H0P51_08115 [Mycobacterium vicinigordonae]
MAPLVEPMHDAFGHARRRVEGLGIAAGKDKQWLRTALFRSEAFDYLAGHPVDHWRIDKKYHRQNGAIHLAHSDGDLGLRILREAPTPGGVPCAGSNRQRRAYYLNRPCAQLGLWGEPKNVSHNLLVLWDECDEGVSLRMVRPIGTGTSLRGVPIDLSVDLPRLRTDFEKLRFEVLDEALDETVDIDEQEDSSGGSA